MKRDLITKHPLLPESKHMLYCTYAPHLLYSQAHIILLHTQLHLLHCDTHLSSPQMLTDWALEAEDSHYTAPMCFGHWALEAHTCPAATARLAALDPHTHLQKRRKDRNGLFVPSLWPVPKRRRIGYSCQTANVECVWGVVLVRFLCQMSCAWSLPRGSRPEPCCAVGHPRPAPHAFPRFQRVHYVPAYTRLIYCINGCCVHRLL